MRCEKVGWRGVFFHRAEVKKNKLYTIMEKQAKFVGVHLD